MVDASPGIFGVEGGEVGSKRRLGIRNDGNMSGLFNAVSIYSSSPVSTGDNIVSNGDTVEVAVGTYECNDSASNCTAQAVFTCSTHTISTAQLSAPPT